ncbi:MAG: GNAT family N-acetyltransferase [Chitinophagia bacterium]|nr:GNAT family N-acetyltransferase [Chitinophagia bacterium]
MRIREVTDRSDVAAFHAAPHRIYRQDPEWVPHVRQEVEAVFDPRRNPVHAHGMCSRWVLEDGRGSPIGRIAAFIDWRKAFQQDPPTGGCGFFECVDDPLAARELFTAAQQWLSKRGIRSMLGPVNFGENAMYWGLLTEGFHRPCHGMNYNPSYYERLFRSQGFRTEYVQISNRLDVASPLPERFSRIAGRALARRDVEIRHLDASRPMPFASDLVEVYNDAWADFTDFTPLDMPVVMQNLRSMRPVLDERMVLFAYVGGVPASFLVVLPDANEWMDGVRGNVDIWGRLVFLCNRVMKKPRRMRAVVMGTRRAFRNKGLESALFLRLRDHVVALGHYRELEQRMLSIHHATGARPSRKHVTLRLNFS